MPNNTTDPSPSFSRTLEATDDTSVKNSPVSPITQIEVLEAALRQYPQADGEKKEVIRIESYQLISKDLDMLRKLQGSQAKFEVLDFPDLDHRGLALIIRHIELERKDFGQKLSARLRERTEAGLNVGNPNIAQAKVSASRQRVRLALFDPTNIDIAQRIARLRASGHNFNNIANDFNDQGLKSRRGGNFYAKSVERIFRRYEAIAHHYDANPHLQQRLAEQTDSPITLSNWKEAYQFDEQIQIHCQVPGADHVQLNLYDWESSEAVLSIPELPVGTPFYLPIAKTLELLPGRHYLEIRGPEGAQLICPFVLAPEIQSIIAVVRAQVAVS